MLRLLLHTTVGEDTVLKYDDDFFSEPQDREIYTDAVRTIFNKWGDDAWVFH
ncbi:MAG: hypothetical protein ABFS56_02730 [Pseudomonadota bacterium]